MSGDEEDLVIYGTPIEREEEITTRKNKAVAEASGHLRTALPPWKQEVTDEEWRSRFHGAFTGEYSAGYHNTVGSKEGWTPQSFTSSRNKRAEVQQQNIFSFLDEDEKAELEGRTLATSMQFDTFGFTAVELARKQAYKEKQQRPSSIPGPVPDELIAPVKESIVAPCQARKGFLARSRDDGSEIAHSNINEDDSGNVPDLSADDDNQFTKSTPPPPAPHLRSKMDSLMLMPDSIVAANVEENVSVEQASSLNPQVNNRKQDGGNEAEDEVEVENVERPVDLYKAIFSDDEDDVEENNTTNQVEETKIEVVNTTLNRLIAGDFLESLGKELGLSLPPEMPLPVVHKEATKGDQEKMESSRNGGSAEKKSNDTRYIQEYPSNDVKFPRDRGSVEDDRKKNRASKVLHNERYLSCHKTHNWSSNSSGDEKRDMKCSKSRRHRSTRSSSLDSDSSNHSDIRDQHRRSRRDDKGSYQEKSSSRKHSKHRKHRRKDSPSRSHRSSELDERKRKNEYGE